MQRLSRIALLAAAFWGAGSACGSDEDVADELPPKVAAVSASLIGLQCHPVTLLEVAHRVGDRVVTDRVRIDDDTAGRAGAALRSFRVAAQHFGEANVVSSRSITQVQCFAAQASRARSTARLDDTPDDWPLCADMFGVYHCDPATPSQVFDVGSGESCTVSNYTDAVSLSCQDSSAIVTRSGEVVVTVNTGNLRNDVLSRTQALRRFVGDENVIANFHFDVLINPDQQAAIIGNQAFNDLAEQIRQASEAGRQIPDIGDFLRWLPQPPQSADFYAQLTKAQEIKQERLEVLAEITSGAPLSPQQVNAFYRNFVEKGRLLDRLDVENSASARHQATGIINETIDQLASANRGSPTYEQVKAGAEAMLEAHTSEGVFAPDRTIDFVVPDLQKSLTDEDVEKRMIGAESLIDLNRAMERPENKAIFMANVLGLLATAMDNDDMDRVWRLHELTKATEFFFDNEDPAGTSYDVHLTHDARALFNIEVEPNSAVAYEVITLLNEVADYNETTGRVTVDYQAVIIINARQALSADDIKRALYHTETAYGILNFLQTAGPAFLGGALDNLGSTITGVFYTAADFIRDPEAFIDNLKSAVVNWRQTLDIILAQGVDVIHRWPNMSVEEKSRLLGQLAAEIVLSLPAKARQAANINEVIRDASRLHLDTAARGLQIVERSGIALAPEAAMELVKRLDHHGITNIDDAIRVLDKIDDGLPCDLVGDVFPLAPPPIVAKPRCTTTQIGDALDALRIRASRMGVKDQTELNLLTQSLAKGKDVLKKDFLNPQEVRFAHRLVDRFYGTVVGPPARDYRAIDGFYDGFPLQLKSSTDAADGRLRTLFDITLQKAHKDREYSYRDIKAGMEMFTQTSAQVIRELTDEGILSQVGEGRVVRSIHIFTADRQWVIVENGGYRIEPEGRGLWDYASAALQPVMRDRRVGVELWSPAWVEAHQ